MSAPVTTINQTSNEELNATMALPSIAVQKVFVAVNGATNMARLTFAEERGDAGGPAFMRVAVTMPVSALVSLRDIINAVTSPLAGDPPSLAKN